MKKLLSLVFTCFVLIGFLGLTCGTEEEESSFSVEVDGDTVKTVAQGELSNFYFDINNLTGSELTVTVDIPESSIDFPEENWYTSLCDETFCYPTPRDSVLPANGAWENVHVTIGSSTEGSEGKVVLEVKSGEEVVTQTFILQISQ